jgi:putative aldouronate transport system substrate-binding protein
MRRLGAPGTIMMLAAALLWAGGAQDKPAPQASDEQKPAGKGAHWIADDVAITYWTEIAARTAATRASHNEIPVYQEAEKITGIKVKFLHPPAAQVTEQFNLMIASGDYPDVIYWGWMDFPGGPEKAIADKVIIKLNDLVARNARDFAGFVNGRPDIARKIVTDQGSLYLFPNLTPYIKDPAESWQRFSTGPMFRGDWLVEMGLQAPKTLDEWETVLTAFKKRGDNIIPLAALPNGGLKAISGLRWMMCAWGANYEPYVVDGKVHYGFAEPEYKDYLTVMNRWYKAGLIDKDFVSREYNQVRGLIAEGRVGAFWGRLNSEMGGFTPLGRKANPGFKLVLAPWPYAKDGKSYHMHGSGGNDYEGSGAAITTKNKHPVETVKWLNFWWTEDGHNLGNFGVEGLTYNWVNGFPKYTDLVMKNPEGLSVVNALSKYAPDGGMGRFWKQDSRYWEQMMSFPEQYEGGKLMASTGDISRAMPAATPTAEESKELAAILSEVTTYRDEMFVKFVVGLEPLAGFDEYLKRISAMGVPKALAIQQASLDRFAKRPVPKF